MKSLSIELEQSESYVKDGIQLQMRNKKSLQLLAKDMS